MRRSGAFHKALRRCEVRHRSRPLASVFANARRGLWTVGIETERVKRGELFDLLECCFEGFEHRGSREALLCGFPHEELWGR